uniref:BTB domain-containing protein n=1 Tax=Strongyloides stercoralis TaxID=6248 RepID=A0A0K0EKJ0_STRER
MTKKYERVNFKKNIVDSFLFFEELLKSEDDIMKSNVVIHCHDNNNEYEDLIIGDLESDCNGLLSQFLEKIFQYTGKFPNYTFFDITIRGAACLNDALIDLVRINNSSNELPKRIEKNFSSWLDPYAPNPFSLSIPNSSYIKPILKFMSKGSTIIKSQLSEEVNRFPRIFIIDIVKLDDKSPETSDAVRWIYIDVPCGMNADIGNKLIKFLQRDTIQTEIKLQTFKDPIISVIKDFLRKDTLSTIIFNSTNNECLQNFENIKNNLLKWCIFPHKSIKLNTEEYLLGTNADVEYFDKYKLEYNFTEILPIVELEKLESNRILLEKINNSLCANIQDAKNKIKKIEEKIIDNKKIINKHEKFNNSLQKQIEKFNENYYIAKEKNLKLKDDSENLSNEKELLSHDTSNKEKKIKELQSKIDKLKYHNNALKKENEEKEKSNKETLVEAEKIYTIGKNMYKQFEDELELISKINSSMEINFDNNKKMSTEVFDIFEMQNIQKNISKIFNKFMELEKECRNNIINLHSTTENQVNLYNDTIKHDEEITFKNLCENC